MYGNFSPSTPNMHEGLCKSRPRCEQISSIMCIPLVPPHLHKERRTSENQAQTIHYPLCAKEQQHKEKKSNEDQR
jgi:hypothetical protein